MDPKQWYYTVGPQRFGPFDDQAVISLILNGAIRPETMVWNAGMPGWMSAGSTELNVHFAPAPAPVPAPPRPSGAKTACIIIAVVGGGFLFFVGLLAAIAIPNFLVMRAKAQMTMCVIAMDSLKMGIESYVGELKTTPDIDDLIKENLIPGEKIKSRCASMSSIIGAGDTNGMYTVTANPNGKFSSTCILILTHTGMNTSPLPPGCRH